MMDRYDDDKKSDYNRKPQPFSIRINNLIQNQCGFGLTVLNLIVLLTTIFLVYFNHDASILKVADLPITNISATTEPTITITNSEVATTATSIPKDATTLEELEQECKDPIWCNIQMPTTSHYKFDPPTDLYRWKLAQLQAARGEPILLRETLKAFPNHFDFLDGDITFRKLHFAMDMFVDERRDLSPLVKSVKRGRVKDLDTAEIAFENKLANGNRRRLEDIDDVDIDYDFDEDIDDLDISNNSTNHRHLAASPIDTAIGKYATITGPREHNGILKYPWEIDGRSVVPTPYDFRAAKRAPVVSIGYTSYLRDGSTYFMGSRIGGAFIDRKVFFKHWRKAMNYIDTPFVAVCSLNENWGFISTRFPNRTAGWGQCCTSDRDKIVYDFLNHKKTLMLVINQHTNVSHPKLLTLPRGIPITWGFTRMIIWDTMRNVAREGKKNKLLFAAASKWGPRPQILRCVSNKFTPEDFDGHSDGGSGPRLDREQYYEKMAGAMFGLGLPGLGYDTFRTWELMTLGTIVVIEKSVGFDRTMWRLPALFIDDFYDVTPELLRQAYVEALYRAKEFEYNRLTMSFWFSVIANVSASMSTQPLLDLFPMHAEDLQFTRPREPYPCGITNTCGPGTKRIPKMSC